MWPSIPTGNESSSASPDQSCQLTDGEGERDRAGLHRGIVGGRRSHEQWRDERQEEMKQLNVKYKHTQWENIQQPIVPDSLAASSSLRASRVVAIVDEEWKCLNIKASDFRSAVSMKSWKSINLIYFCCSSYSADAFCFCCLKCHRTSLYRQI